MLHAIVQFAEPQISKALRQAHVSSITGAQARPADSRITMQISDGDQSLFRLTDDELLEGDFILNGDPLARIAGLRQVRLQLLQFGWVFEGIAVAKFAMPLLKPLRHALRARRLV